MPGPVNNEHGLTETLEMPLDLDYQDFRRTARRRRRQFVIGALLVLSTVAVWRGRAVVSAFQIQYFQRRCLRFEKPATTIAYDCDGKNIAALSAIDTAYRLDGNGCGYIPGSLASLRSLERASYCAPVIFMHERVSPGGKKRLVIVEAPDYPFRFRRIVWIPESLLLPHKSFALSPLAEFINLGSPDPLEGRDPTGVFPGDPASKWNRDRTLKNKSLKIFFGQPDPNDSSHFTIRYEIDGVPGIMEGWLGDDDAVRMLAHGPWAVPRDAYSYGNSSNIMCP